MTGLRQARWESHLQAHINSQGWPFAYGKHLLFLCGTGGAEDTHHPPSRGRYQNEKCRQLVRAWELRGQGQFLYLGVPATATVPFKRGTRPKQEMPPARQSVGAAGMGTVSTVETGGHAGRFNLDALDWVAYDAAIGNHLSSAHYKYSLTKVGVRANWIKLLDAVGQWKVATLNVEPNKLVNATPGLGVQYCQDINEDCDAEGIGKGKGKKKERDKEQERMERRRVKEEDKERRRQKAEAQPKETKEAVGDEEKWKQERREKKKEQKKVEERGRMKAGAEADAQAAADAAAESELEELEKGMDITDVEAVSEELIDPEGDLTMQDVLTPSSPRPDQAMQITQVQSKSTTPIPPPLMHHRGVSLNPLDFITSLDDMTSVGHDANGIAHPSDSSSEESECSSEQEAMLMVNPPVSRGRGQPRSSRNVNVVVMHERMQLRE
ncbi:hypothetical protein BS17DRAFT_770533 [Gyrodon lividus]|nr:hypothetical protein BS17DRAFT_770533 [Gyrodon lividus]